MSDEPKPAARRTEWIAHDNSQHFKFLVWAAMTAAQARYISIAFAWTPAGAAIFVGSVLIEWWVGDWVESKVEDLAAAYAQPAVPRVASGSPNVWINDKEAVRGQQEDRTDTCHVAKVEQGSQWVSINRKPASRWGDRTSCGGGATIQKNPGLPREEVFIGGPPSYYSNTAGYHRGIRALWNLFSVYRGFSEGIGDGLESVGSIAGQQGLDWFKERSETPRP